MQHFFFRIALRSSTPRSARLEIAPGQVTEDHFEAHLGISSAVSPVAV